MPTVARRKPSLEGRGREQSESRERALGLRLATVAACRPNRKSGRGEAGKSGEPGAYGNSADKRAQKAGDGRGGMSEIFANFAY